jgi:hypothetical protein
MNDTPAIGHNNPPTEKQIMEERHADLFKRLRDLIARAADVPAEVKDDDTCGKVGDLIKAMRTCLAQVDSTRKIENEDIRRRLGEINNTFTKPADELGKVRDEIKARNDAYLSAKADAEKLRLEELAAEQRRKAEVATAAAAAAETKRLAAEREAAEAKAREDEARQREAQAKADQTAAELRAAAAAAEEERQVIERRERDRARNESLAADLRFCARLMKEIEMMAAIDAEHGLPEAEAARLDGLIGVGSEIVLAAARLRGNAYFLDAEQDKEATHLNTRLSSIRWQREMEVDAREASKHAAEVAERQRRREAEDARLAEAKRLREVEEAAAAAAKAKAVAARAEVKSAAADQKEAARDIRQAGRDEKTSMAAGERLDASASKIERKAGGPESDLARTRGDLGSVNTVSRRWTVRVVDIRVLDLDKLRFHIHPDALQAAAQGFLQAGGRELQGAVIEHAREGVTV